MEPDRIEIRGAREHNLKGVDVDLPKNRLVVITGPSGSGKSSLAFDTLFAEGQRRYVESLSAYARQFLGQLKKPSYDAIRGLSPTIAIEQKTVTSNPRSTVGTVTEIHDYLRVLFARAGVMICPSCGSVVRRETPGQMVETILAMPEGTKLSLMAPLVRRKKGDFGKLLEKARKDGFVRARIDGAVVELEGGSGTLKTDARKEHTIELVIDRLVVKDGIRARLLDSLETALKYGESRVVLAPADGTPDLRMSTEWRCENCDRELPELSPALFSFNAPHGMCPECKGLGTALEVDPDKLVPDPSLSLDEGAIVPWAAVLGEAGRERNALTAEVVDAVCRAFDIPRDAPFADLDDHQKAVLFFGSPEPIRFTAQRAHGTVNYEVPFEGVAKVIERRWKDTKSEAMREQYQAYMSSSPCPACGGARLREEARFVRFAGKTLPELLDAPLTEAYAFFAGDMPALSGNAAIVAADAVRELKSRLRFLCGVGLGYLSLSRGAGTLSGGESQRIRLAAQIGTELTGIVYVLDEPSIGLHAKDGAQLVEALIRLRDLGNSVVVVEHDEAIMRAADWIVDVGPGAGEAGGNIMGSGPPDAIMADPKSVTGAWLAGRLAIPVPAKRRKPKAWVTIEDATEHNLQHLDVKLPVGVLTVVTGVSGAGKSTLVSKILEPAARKLLNGAQTKVGAHKRITGLDALDKVVTVDQQPIGKTPRSNPATYTKVWDDIRQLFAATKEARAAGYGPARFSFNVKGGRCEACQGDGVVKVEMHFLPDVWVTCEVCRGRRFNDATLRVKYHGLDIAEVLDLSITEARAIFAPVTRIARVLDTLEAVGLGYLRLGQPANTLSGGEAQRIKLSRELAKTATGKTLYVLDEPSTGLHFQDVEKLVAVLDKLVEQGNTVVVIEHHLDLVKRADWVVDLGPGGGHEGGRLVAAGTPEAIAKAPDSHTARYLAPLLAPPPARPAR
ncbi:MAG: excinuclease ABC subunit UvrA [Myxococcota bacterium]